MPHSLAYEPLDLRMSSSCVPSSMMCPDSMTMIRSICLKVERRCAIAMTVLCVITLSSANCMACSLSLSSDDVASSSMRIGASFKIARAIPIRCFCPPDNFTPRSPTCASYPLRPYPRPLAPSPALGEHLSTYGLCNPALGT